MKSPSELGVAVASAQTTALVYHAEGNHPIGATLILGHGAGAGQRSAFMVDFASALAALGLDVVTFNFLYSEQRRRIPDRAPVLEACYVAVVAAARAAVASASTHLFIGGKSMGGRIATHIAASDPQLRIDGLVLLGYPLHPPGRPDQKRDKHLPSIARPMLVVQGSRDAFGLPAELMPILERLTPQPTLEIVNDSDHSFKLPRRNPAAQAAVFANMQSTIVKWITSQVREQSRSG